nr:MAG TPA: hypothetical protein [Caudoviricetes sp.]
MITSILSNTIFHLLNAIFRVYILNITRDFALVNGFLKIFLRNFAF